MLKQLTTLIITLTLFGCTTTQITQHQNIPWAQRKAQLEKLQQWQIIGQASINVSNKTSSFTINPWNQCSENNYSLVLSDYGIEQARLIRTPENFSLTARGKTSIAPDPETLLEEKLNWPLPINDLYYWVRGLPAPGDATSTLDDLHRLKSLNQAGWNIQYEYDNTQLFKNNDLPSLLILNNPSHQLSARIAISQWQSNAKCSQKQGA